MVAEGYCIEHLLILALVGGLIRQLEQHELTVILLAHAFPGGDLRAGG